MLLESLREDYGATGSGVVIEDVTGMNESILDAEIAWNKIIMEQVVTELNEEAGIVNESAGNFIDKIIQWFKDMISKIGNFIKDIFSKIVNNLRGIELKLKAMLKIAKAGNLKDENKTSIAITAQDVNLKEFATKNAELFNTVNTIFEKRDGIDEVETSLKKSADEISKLLTVKSKNITYSSDRAVGIISTVLGNVMAVSKAKGLLNANIKAAQKGNSLAAKLKSGMKKDKTEYDEIKITRKIVSIANTYTTKFINYDVKQIKIQFKICRSIITLFKKEA